ncbi:hypothetical protein, partial [Mycolicibacterium arseniciresistens]
DDPALPWRPGPWWAGAAAVGVGGVVSGVAGALVVGAALAVRYVLRNRARLLDRITIGTVATGLIAAGAVLSQTPWRSVDGYAGHSVGVQLLALISVATLAASAVPDRREPDPPGAAQP